MGIAAGGGNPSGFNIQQLPGTSGPSIGMPGQNPMMAPFPSGPSMPNPGLAFGPGAFGGSPINFGGGIPGDPLGFGGGPGGWMGQKNALRDAFHKAGYPSAIADMMSTFLGLGAGYNPGVLQALFAQLGPQIQNGEADIMEHFGAMGQGMSSPAAMGMGQFLSGVNLNEGQIASQLYEQSIQNFMNLLTGAKAPKGGGSGSLLGGIGQLAGGIAGAFGGGGIGDIAGLLTGI